MEDQDGIDHEFMVRQDWTLKVRLPKDLTMQDVNRIHRWMLTLPFDDRVLRASRPKKSEPEEEPFSSPRIGHGMGDDPRNRR